MRWGWSLNRVSVAGYDDEPADLYVLFTFLIW